MMNELETTKKKKMNGIRQFGDKEKEEGKKGKDDSSRTKGKRKERMNYGSIHKYIKGLSDYV